MSKNVKLINFSEELHLPRNQQEIDSFPNSMPTDNQAYNSRAANPASTASSQNSVMGGGSSYRRTVSISSVSSVESELFDGDGCGGNGSDDGETENNNNSGGGTGGNRDPKYWERRRKNNLAAKKSRDARRIRENQLRVKVMCLESQNQVKV